jgi:exodeoxyribonuclease-1
VTADFTFYWHDYETFGRDARRDWPAQFAGVRTDADLHEIEPPTVLWCRPPRDRLPDPESCLITGILPQRCDAEGLPEHAFAAEVLARLGQPGTVGTGYNTLRFDDEFTRFLLWRNLLDPYGREWRDGCGRWDLVDLVRCAWALRPDGLQWPRKPDGRPSFRLEDLTAANGLAHESAHDALSDVQATLALARRLKAVNGRLWDYCLALRHKARVQEILAPGQPVIHVSGMYGTERGCLAVVVPLATHPVNRNEVIVWDLAQDPSGLLELTADEVRERLFTRREVLEARGLERLPVKTLHLNRSPVVIPQLGVLKPELAQRWGVDMTVVERHAQRAAPVVGPMAGVWAEVFARPAAASPADVDEDLYGGFVPDADRARLERLRAQSPEELARARPVFADGRLDELLWRYRARNFPETLDDAERERWMAHCHARLHGGHAGRAPIAEWLERIDALGADAGDREQAVLSALVDWAEAIAPDA